MKSTKTIKRCDMCTRSKDLNQWDYISQLSLRTAVVAVSKDRHLAEHAESAARSTARY